MTHLDPLGAAITGGDRGALARAITLAESGRDEDQRRCEQLLTWLLPQTGKALRLGITGAPGVGKSTLIDALGTHWCRQGRRVAVLAVDPSSTVTGGSILGDLTRMQHLVREPDAFVRASPGGGQPGGVTARTREAILLCEAAGFDTVLIETIGTGQSETAVADMTDFLLLLLSPAAGDELQGIKRGVMELCDGVVIHKADGELVAAAERSRQQCALALAVLRGTAAPFVHAVSSLQGTGIDGLAAALQAWLAAARRDGGLERRRARQRESWFDAALRERLLRRVLGETADARVDTVRAMARDGLLPTALARDLAPG